ncbi:STAS domain-containing protein [Mycolicibacterium celeriflavum]|uniref:Sulfate transporter n=1 Tax=Mycolicibacterium celeriflavum TaxID=1249101 RepID=A0A7I7RMR7_MYCCF|nr:STAS domain-containing protein [Mycolicibacterium celeriflavum]BBY45892.1 sulfate transporter [Mycolicibacterium celeriflavum]
MTDDVCALDIAADAFGGATVLTPDGLLDSRTYRPLRDRIIKAALDEPTAVIVDVTTLDVPAESAWAVFTSARWHVDRWPEIPIMLVCEHLDGRSAIIRNGITRYVPVYPTIRTAVEALVAPSPLRIRRRARAYLPGGMASLRRTRELVDEWLTAWAQPELIPVAKVVATAFVENAVAHAKSDPNLRLESDGSAVTVAVEDGSHAPAGVRECGGGPPTGLRIVTALCRAWGNAPTPSGKTVWAVIGPENRL